MTTTALPVAAPTSAHTDKIFPTLTPAQIARIAVHGQARDVRPGEILMELGQQGGRVFVVTAGELEVVRRSGDTEVRVAVHHPGQFTGEVNTLSGRPGFAEVRASEASQVIQIEHEDLLSLVQTDAELSEIIMRAYILRRVELISHGFGDVVLIGSNHCSGTLRVREFLTRNGHPYTTIDLD